MKNIMWVGAILISFLQAYAQVGGRPVITDDPASDTLAAGGSVTFAVAATGFGLSYQWQKNDLAIAGATQTTYSINGVSQSDAGLYRAIVSNFAGRDTTPNATLVIATAPVIVSHPRDTSVVAGQPTRFTVAASGSAPLSYQWQKNGVNITGATGVTLNLIPALAGDSGSYRVIVSNNWGSAVSNPAKLSVYLPAQIVSQPSDTTVRVGQSATFSAGASGTSPLAYRWQKNGTTIAGARAATYTIPSVAGADSGLFRMIASNAYGSDTSTYAALTVLPPNSSSTSPPVITTQPRDTAVALGKTASFFVVALSSSAMTYQWQKNGVRIPGAQGSSYSLSQLLLQDAGQFQVIVSNQYGSDTSNVATLTVGTAPVITQQPASASVQQGGGIGFSVIASGTAPLSYQWQKYGVAIGGATASTYSIASAAIADSGRYTVLISNPFGSVVSNAAFLTVRPTPVVKPSIVNNPASATAVVGDTVSLTVTASGTAPLSYQWQKNGVTIANAPSATLTLYTVAMADSGIYRVVVSNSAGSVTSSTATVQVIPKSTGQTKPVLTQSPSSQTAQAGNMVTFNVTATGARPLSYQWQKNSTNIGGATDSIYSIAAVALADSGAYRVIVSNSLGADTSAGATLTVTQKPAGGNAPVVLSHPSSQSAQTGDTVTFSVIASGTAPLAYQWQKNGVGIANAQSATLTLLSVAPADSGTYRAVVTNSYGSATSNGALLTVTPRVIVGNKPVVTNSPASIAVVVGASAVFSAAATGTAPLYYQWQKNGANIPNANATSYAINAVASGDSGAYRFVVFSSLGSDTSYPAILTVLQAPVGQQKPVIVQNPTPQSTLVGDTVSFWVSAAGARPFSYQWQKNGVNIAGSNDSSLTINTVALTDSGTYRVIVTNSIGVEISGNAHLTVSLQPVPVGIAPVIRSNPSSQTAVSGSSVTFTVVATGTVPLSYQWQKNGNVIAGATNAGFTIASITQSDSGSYRVTVSNSAGGLTSFEAILTVVTPPLIRSAPASQTVVAGSTVTFTVVASGSSPLSYQWQKNGVSIAGATGASLIIAAAAASDGGSYQVIVTNAWGTATSNAAGLTVSASPLAGKVPVITQQPSSQTAQAGDSVVFSVTAVSTDPLSYQWQKNLVNMAGATGPILAIGSATAQDSGTYRVLVSTKYGSVTSNAAVLTVVLQSAGGIRPTIIRNPTSLTASLGDTVSFSLSASGTAPLYFQWQRAGVAIPGATDSVYTIDSVRAGDWGAYTVIISNSWGRDTSTGGVLTLKNAGPSAKPVAYWTHNPVRASEGASFTVDIPDTGKAGAFVADMAGNMVFSLITKNTPFNPGRYEIAWSGQNVSGSFAGAGVYIYVFTYTRRATGKTTVIRKPVFLVK